MSSEAIPRHGKGWPPRNAWVLAPKSIMITCPAGNHSHRIQTTVRGWQLISVPASASSVPLCARGQSRGDTWSMSDPGGGSMPPSPTEHEYGSHFSVPVLKLS